MFSAGLSLADFAAELGLKPKTVREAFCDLYSRFALRNQLELLSALKSLSLTRSSGTFETARSVKLAPTQ